MAISAAGVGSNLDVDGIVSKLMAVEQLPLTALGTKEAKYQSRLSAYGNIGSALSSFQSAVNGLSDSSKFQAVKATPADTSILTASGSSAAVAGSYNLDITALAQSQKLAATGQASITSAIGAGASTTLTFDFGTISGGVFNSGTGHYTGASFAANGTTKTVTIDSTNNSLSGIRDAINSADIGVTATIVNDGSASPYRLVIASDTMGKDNSIKLSVSGDATLTTLLANDPTGVQNLAETTTGQNAAFTVNGISISKATNTVTDAISGVTLNLLKTTTSTTTLTVAKDTASVVSSVGSFVKSYNDLNKTLSDLSAYNATTKQAGILAGDAGVRTIQSQVRSTLTSMVSGLSGGYSQLSQIGISLQKDGTLALNASKLQTAMEDDYSAVTGLFASVGTTSDSLVSFVSSTSSTNAATSAISITAMASQGAFTGAAGHDFAAPLTIDATNNTFALQVDGKQSNTITLTSGSYASGAALATEIQNKINSDTLLTASGKSVTVAYDGGTKKFTVTSASYGSSSKVDFTSIDTNTTADIGFSIAAGTAGVDVAGTINGITATGSGQYLTGTDGLKLLISGGSTGSRGSVTFTRGVAYQFSKQVDDFLSTTGVVATKKDGVNRLIKDITSQRERLNRRLAETETRYRAQFTKLDVLMGNMSKTSNFLTAELAKL